MSDRQVSEVRTSQREPEREQRIFTFKATYLIWLCFGVLEALLALRLLLKLIGANANSPFAALLYNVTHLFLAPFAGLMGTPSAGGLVLEISTIIALLVYALVGWALERLVWVIFYRPRGPVVEVTQRSSSDHRTG